MLAIYVRPTKAPQNAAETHSNVRVEKGLCLRFESKSTIFLALVKPNRVTSCLRQGASAGPSWDASGGAPSPAVGGDGRGYPGWIHQQPEILLLARATRT